MSKETKDASTGISNDDLSTDIDISSLIDESADIYKPYRFTGKVFFNGVDLSTVSLYRQYSHRNLPPYRPKDLENIPSSRKKVLIGLTCGFECGKLNDDKSSCKCDLREQYSNIVCPYVKEVIASEEPRKNSKDYEAWYNLCNYLSLERAFGEYTRWAMSVEKKIKGELPIEMYRILKTIPEFCLGNITMSEISLEEYKKKIEENRDYNKYKYLTSSFSKLSWTRKLVIMYVRELSQFSDGLTLRCFLNEREREYSDWKDRMKSFVNLEKIGKYFILYSNFYTKDNLSGDCFKTKTLNDNIETEYSYFHEDDLSKAINFFQEAIVPGASNEFVMRYFSEMLTKEKQK